MIFLCSKCVRESFWNIIEQFNDIAVFLAWRLRAFGLIDFLLSEEKAIALRDLIRVQWVRPEIYFWKHLD